ncbi:NlpC/P60 family protein [Geodermatophilus sp. Leaf369]|uniref:C40 family peptidase n=1 Tax=Geodermatophilus sp. Leaf369 TaxID=1736354 RepID=UPI001F2FC077|nr:C40 family peptidase [Geodermatophilus sp. Leaf369]
MQTKVRGTLRGERGQRWSVRFGGVLIAAAVAVGIAPGTASAAPVNPSDGEIAQAQTAQDAAAAEVGAISAQLASAQSGVATAQQESAIALDSYQQKQEEYETARAAADTAAAAATQATADLGVAQVQLSDFARTSYMEGSTFSGAASLLDASSPGELIERAALLEAAGADHSDVLDEVTVLQQQATAADAAAQTALADADALQAEAADSLAAAQAAETSARAQAAALAQQQVTLDAQLQAAQQVLLGLEGAREAAEAYAQQQAADAAAEAAAQTQAQQQAAAAAAAANRPSTPAASAPSSSRPTTAAPAPAPAPSRPVTPAPAPVAGPANASASTTAINAAMRYLGTPYSWGGGGSRGPGYGISPDTGVYGFDCSGLTQYAYAQAGISIPRNSQSQYNALPKVSRANLQPGDLVFWGTNGSASRIYHVAIYIGNNKVVQAPQSGDVVKVSSIWNYDYAGAARPSA